MISSGSFEGYEHGGDDGGGANVHEKLLVWVIFLVRLRFHEIHLAALPEHFLGVKLFVIYGNDAIQSPSDGFRMFRRADPCTFRLRPFDSN